MGEHTEKVLQLKILPRLTLPLDWLCVSKIQAQYFTPSLRVLSGILGAEKSPLITRIRKYCLKEKSNSTVCFSYFRKYNWTSALGCSVLCSVFQQRINLYRSLVCWFAFVSGFIVFLRVEGFSNNCLFLLSKKFSTQVLQQVDMVARRHHLLLCVINLLPEEEKTWLCLDCRASVVNIYRNQHCWQKWNLQRSSGSKFSAKTREEETI